MLWNHIKISVRNFFKNRGYAFINLFGLTIGLAAATLMLLFVMHELSFDKFHKDADQLHRVSITGKIQGPELIAAASCVPIGPTMVEEHPDIINYTRLFPFGGDPVVRVKDLSFVETGFLYVDSTFFDLFTVRFINGDEQMALTRPNTIVLTESIAIKYFGKTDVVGESIQVFEPPQDFEVTAVIEDYPENSHISFDLLAPFGSHPLAANQIWVSNNVYTYIKTTPKASVEQLERTMTEIVDKYVGPQFEQFLGMTLEEMREAGNRYGYITTPVKDIHLKSDMDFEFQANGSMSSIYIFSAIAIFLILIASFNFMNLATARASTRSKEVGLRKVVGAPRSSLIMQFLTESTIITIISFALALVVAILALPYFNDIANQNLTWNLINWKVFGPVIAALIVFVSLLSGAYPAFYLASFNPIAVMTGSKSTGMKSGWLRRGLVILQFFFTISLISSTLLVNKQINFIVNQDLGFNKENVLVIDRAFALGNQRQAFMEEIGKVAEIESIGTSSHVPGGLAPGNTVFRKEASSNEEMEPLNFILVDYGFKETLNIHMASGRFFSRDYSADSVAIVINEAAARSLGWDDPVGKLLYQIGGGVNGADLPLTVIGVCADYNYESLHQEVAPLLIALNENAAFGLVRYSEGSEAIVVEKTKALWEEMISNQSFEYGFVEDYIKENYQDDERMKTLFTIFAVLAMVIGIFGLLGLTSFITIRRKKEISIRKCMGAPIGSIIKLLLKETIWLIGVASILAWPATWFFMNNWQQNFAYKANLGWLAFIIATLIALVISVSTIFYYVYKAAQENPVNALKYD